MKIFKTIISTIIATNVLLGCNYVFADEIVSDSELGLGASLIDDQEAIDYYANIKENQDEEITPYSLIIDNVDLSTSAYFPPIGNQGQLGSCVAWATTYYAFTYQVNKLKGITSTSNNAYSPSWTWNYLNKGNNNGINIFNAFSVLSTQGAVHKSEMNYNTSSYDYSWSNNTAAMIEALKIRVDNNSLKWVWGSGTRITNNKDNDLDSIKMKLLEGNVLLVETQAEPGLANWSWKNNGNSQLVAYRARTCSPDKIGGHCMTVVGYNDNITLDVNNNGVIEDCEKGAFKVANSWGTSWGNSGYIWVLYDALNYVSANTTNNWESNESGTRCCIFSHQSADNDFYYIEVGNHDVNFIGKANINTSYRNQLSVSIGKSSNTSSNMQNTVEICNKAYMDSSDLARYLPFNGSILMDYGVCTGNMNISDFYERYKWYIRIKDNSAAGTINSASYQIIDDKQNIITNFGNFPSISNGGTYETSRNIDLIQGDVNYDGTVGLTDLATVQRYVNGLSTFSNVQKYLADVDCDGDVDSDDVAYISRYLVG